MSDHRRPLEGIRVLDIATFIAAPMAASILGEFGAEVIKIEQPRGGDPLRHFGVPSVETDDTFCWLSEARNKKSVTLNLRRTEGADILRELVAKSDVLCENFRPGTLEKWGLGYEELSRINPALVMLRVSGFGQDGPYSARPGFARIAHAFGGLAHLTGMDGGPPLTPGSTSLADYVSGVYGALGVMLAMRARDADGRGQYIDLALYEPILRMLDDLAPAYAARGIVRGRQGLGTSNACPHGHFETKDGWIAIACTNDRMFSRLAAAMGRPEMADPALYGIAEARLRDAGKIDAMVQEWVGTMSTQQIVTLCAHQDVPCASVNTIEGIFADPHIAHRQNQVALRHDRLGEVHVPSVVPKLSRTPGQVDSLGPELGSSNVEILSGILGMDEGKIQSLKAAGII